MIKLPKDKHNNEGWVVKARKPHRCEGYRHDGRFIERGDHYYRAIAWPGDDANGGSVPWVLKLCRECISDDMKVAFDAAIQKALDETGTKPLSASARARKSTPESERVTNA